MNETEEMIREQIQNRIGRLAASYVPEWRFDREHPDLGSALAILFSGMMAQSVMAGQKMMETYRISFFNQLKAEPLGAGRAEGYLTFGLVKDDMPEALVPAGALVEGEGADGQTVAYVTEREVYVSAASVSPVLAIEGGWYLCFSKAPSQGLISLLFLLKDSGYDRNRILEWSYYGRGGWTSLSVSDDTKRLSRTGLVCFAGMEDFKETVCEERTGWWIRVCSGGSGKLPALPDGVFINVGKVTAKDPGEEGNLPPGGEFQLGSTIGFVSDIKNPDLLFGGSGEETVSNCIRRNAAMLRHGNRAVSPGDYEQLIYAASDRVERVACFGGYAADGTRRSGTVTLVVLQKNYLGEQRYFYKLREHLRACLKGRISPVLEKNGGPDIIAPWFVTIDVSAFLYVSDHSRVIPAKAEAQKALFKYLDPVNGGNGGMGWEYGELPGYDQISHMLLRIPDVRYVRQVCLITWLDKGGGPVETEWEKLRFLPWVLPVSGTHKLQIMVTGEDTKRSSGESIC